MSSFGFGKSKNKGYNKLEEATEFEEFDKSAVALNAAIEAAELTAQTSGNIFDQIAYVELLLQKTPGNKSYNQNLKELKARAAVLAASAAAAAASAAAEEDYKSGSEGSVVGSEGSAGAFPDDGGKKSRYSRKSKSRYSRKSKSKSKYSRKSKSKYSRKSKSKYSRKY